MKRLNVPTLLMALALLPVPAAPASDSARPAKQAIGTDPVTSVARLSVAAPTFSEGIFPCTNCHAEMKPDLKRRQLQGEHTDIVLRHAAGQLWCLDCHHPENRDSLRLMSGEGLPFTASYRLCGQCHGKKLRDWELGSHGRRSGQWNGAKEYLLCTHCHDPHDPPFKALTPMPPPARPGRTGH